MATGTGNFTTYHAGRDASLYINKNGDYYTQSSSSTEDGGYMNFTSYDSFPGGRMKGHFDIKLCKYDHGNTYMIDCVDNLIQLIGAFDVGVANPVCSVTPTGSTSEICYQVGSNIEQTFSSDNQSVIQAYFDSSDNATKISLNLNTFDNELNLSTAGVATGESDMSNSGNQYYDNGTAYFRTSGSDVDGGSINFTEYGVVGERIEGQFATTLCKYGFNFITGLPVNGHALGVRCDDSTIWLRGAFSILRSADQ